ncbi:MAG TPA: GIY-YIG nuclease family protein, partial [Dehalococcoidales bacterium]|nr:GIY-YIG nuclease family protein [Dehalococcoidales bacterium]
GGYFTGKYKLDKLVFFETTDDVAAAIWREKRLKTWERAWKIRLIEKLNPDWHDLFDDLLIK